MADPEGQEQAIVYVTQRRRDRRVMLGICYKTRLVDYGEAWLRPLLENVMRLMRRDLSEEKIRPILADKPRRLLTFV